MTFRLFIAISALSAILLASQGCAHFDLSAGEPAPGDEFEHETMNTFFWGILQDNEKVKMTKLCKSGLFNEVRASTNPGYTILSLVTLGIWVPMDMRWKCRKPILSEGEIE